MRCFLASTGNVDAKKHLISPIWICIGEVMTLVFGCSYIGERRERRGSNHI